MGLRLAQRKARQLETAMAAQEAQLGEPPGPF